jgi:HD-GYP domain-containing protein (c-di-GMP phosphodiesterase class II)/tRNA A-37 threonylcarbamoyl transferase component Bud32
LNAADPVLNARGLTAPAQQLLRDVINLGLIETEAIRGFLTKQGEKLTAITTRERAGIALHHAGLLTVYQRDRVIAGNTFGLMLGPYRVLDRIGGGSVGIVFLGEHSLLRRRVALKVLPVNDDEVPQSLIERFRAETRILASIHHPHVVTAFDAGVVPSPGGGEPTLHYLVLEHIPGGDLENYAYAHGRLPVPLACEWARQAAAGLQAAHDRHLVHRDVKPSNLLLTADQRVKLVDFGLARHLSHSITRPGTLIGSVDFMSPEQSLDPTAVGPAADVYGLGATLFWLLTGELPIPRGESLAQMVRTITTATPRHVRELRADIPEELDQLLARMMFRDPAARPTAVEVMHDLAAFVEDDNVTRLHETVQQLEGSLRAKDDAVRKAQAAVLFAMAKMAGSHDSETEGHLRRMQEYVRLLAQRLCDDANWAMLADSEYVEELVRSVPLHDIGKIGLPDAVFQKAGPLEPDEWEVVRSHPIIGVEILEALAREHGETLTFLRVARVVVRHHHERWDGDGYPDQLASTAIPPAARLVALADVYDSLRRDRPHRPGLSHAQAALAILSTTGQFDPAVMAAFQATEQQFDDVWATIPG